MDRGGGRLTSDKLNSGKGRRLAYSGVGEAWFVLGLEFGEGEEIGERELGEASCSKLEGRDEVRVMRLAGVDLRWHSSAGPATWGFNGNKIMEAC